MLPNKRILEQVWGENRSDKTHYPKVFVRRLRQKLGDNAAQARHIRNERGVGYRFVGPHRIVTATQR